MKTFAEYFPPTNEDEMNTIQASPELAEASEIKDRALLPCPFCGAPEPVKETVRAYRKADWRSNMRCVSCGASSGPSDPMSHDDSENAAIEIWNGRVNSAPRSSQPKILPNKQSVQLASG